MRAVGPYTLSVRDVPVVATHPTPDEEDDSLRTRCRAHTSHPGSWVGVPCSLYGTTDHSAAVLPGIPTEPCSSANLAAVKTRLRLALPTPQRRNSVETPGGDTQGSLGAARRAAVPSHLLRRQMTGDGSLEGTSVRAGEDDLPWPRRQRPSRSSAIRLRGRYRGSHHSCSRPCHPAPIHGFRWPGSAAVVESYTTYVPMVSTSHSWYLWAHIAALCRLYAAVHRGLDPRPPPDEIHPAILNQIRMATSTDFARRQGA